MLKKTLLLWLNKKQEEMNISYNWLKNYLDIDIEPDKLSEILTNTGLEVGGVEEFESIKGGLEGLVIGKVESCEKHPNSDHLSLTTVNVGQAELLPIVCGAPNVAQGQKVVVATVGTTLYNGDESFLIKKSKIRGELSLGMICAEDEIGVGVSHDGIMVLPSDAQIGALAKDYFSIEKDIVFEIDLTPNRIDGASHIGVARDVAAFLKQTADIDIIVPNVDLFSKDNDTLKIDVVVENTEVCPRYVGVTLTDIKVESSPEWLQNRLKAIGLSPINNIVDITNFVLHEVGQPLHAFDASKIKGNRVVVKTMPNKTPFTTLDEEKRELHSDDLMICNAEDGMCIAGVFGGAESGVTNETTSIFLESACFHPVSVRKTARRHGLNTDASFRFERGVDPNITVYALKRAALLIKEIAGAKISSDIVDVYPEPVAPFEVELRLKQVTRLIGEELAKEKVIGILEALEIEIHEDKGEVLSLRIPPYRVDVNREVDVIEEILRIYGYNTVPIYDTVNSTLAYERKPNKNLLQNLVSEQLSSNGFNEMMANSLTKQSYYNEDGFYSSGSTVKIFNPLSQDLNGMRQTLMFGVLEAVIFNSNRQNSTLKLYEFGNCYNYNGDSKDDNPLKKYTQKEKLALAVTGNSTNESWGVETKGVSFSFLKAQVENVLSRVGVDINKLEQKVTSCDLYKEALVLSLNDKEIAVVGAINKSTLKQFDIKQDVYFAELNWGDILKGIRNHKVQFVELSKYPEVRRDLSLLLDCSVSFNTIKDIAFKVEKKLLKAVSLFDVYEGKNLGENKKSYAVSFMLQDETKTLKDKQIDKIMNKMISVLKEELNAQIR